MMTVHDGQRQLMAVGGRVAVGGSWWQLVAVGGSWWHALAWVADTWFHASCTLVRLLPAPEKSLNCRISHAPVMEGGRRG